MHYALQISAHIAIHTTYHSPNNSAHILGPSWAHIGPNLGPVGSICMAHVGVICGPF
jgi:hypothetical protein